MLKITERKNTTRAGLVELAKLVEDINQRLESDLCVMKSPEFAMTAPHDNGHLPGDIHYHSWITYSGRWKYNQGVIDLCSMSGGGDEEINIWRVISISFTAAVESLQKLVHEYNDLSTEKDTKIQKFLDICTAYHAEQPTG